MPEDGLEDVERKRASFDDLHRKSGWVHRKLACDLWVAAFYAPKTDVPPSPGLCTVPLTDHVWLAWAGSGLKDELIERAEKIARESSFFHWPIEFADVMSDGGFDCVIGNPPWERMKLQEQEFFASRDSEIATVPTAAARTHLIGELKKAELGSPRKRLYQQFESAKRTAEAGSALARVPGGRFPLTGRGDVNTYALFAELFSCLSGVKGRAGVIVPTGIATDSTTAPFFASLIENRRLASLTDFENRKRLFPAVDSRMKFSLLAIGQNERTPAFAFFLTDPVQMSESERRFTLTPSEIARINPNTKTVPVFRAKADAELTAKIYSRVPVLIDEANGDDGNSWGATFHSRIWHMAEDSDWFQTTESLREMNSTRLGRDWGQIDPDDKEQAVKNRFVPLYEAKMLHQFDHRWATYHGADSRDVRDEEKQNSNFEPAPRYWVSDQEVTSRLEARNWRRGWLMAWRDICRSTDERTAIFSIIPKTAVGHTSPLMFVDKEPVFWTAILANLNSLILDYVARQSVGGTHLTFGYLKQFAVLPPSAYKIEDLAYISERVLELTYTSESMRPFAEDLGYDGVPFEWNVEKRAKLRAELDAWYARAYGLTRDELRYILDPSEVFGSQYPSETFRGLKNNDLAKYPVEEGSPENRPYRTAWLVLDAWDRLHRGEWAPC